MGKHTARASLESRRFHKESKMEKKKTKFVKCACIEAIVLRTIFAEPKEVDGTAGVT